MEFEPFLPVQRWIDVVRVAYPLFFVNCSFPGNVRTQNTDYLMVQNWTSDVQFWTCS